VANVETRRRQGNSLRRKFVSADLEENSLLTLGKAPKYARIVAVEKEGRRLFRQKMRPGLRQYAPTSSAEHGCSRSQVGKVGPTGGATFSTLANPPKKLTNKKATVGNPGVRSSDILSRLGIQHEPVKSSVGVRKRSRSSSS